MPDAVPAVATIVAVPLPTAVTSPAASTVATATAPLAQVTVDPAIGWPFWSRTSAASCTVAPRAASRAVEGVTVTVVGRGAAGVGAAGSAVSPPQLEAHAVAASMTAVGTQAFGPLTAEPAFPCCRIGSLRLQGTVPVWARGAEGHAPYEQDQSTTVFSSAKG